MGVESSSLRPEHLGFRPEAGRSRILSRILWLFYLGPRLFYFGLGQFYFGLQGEAGESCGRMYAIAVSEGRKPM